MKKRLLAFFLALCALLFSACTPPKPEQNAEALSFTDALGRTVSVPQKPVRVAALTGSFADVWVLAGGDICAAPRDAWEDFNLSLPDAVDLGGAHSPNAEVLLAQEPDLVLASASVASNIALEPLLTSCGIPVLYFDVDNFDDYLEMLRICTEITGRKDLYETNGLAIKAKIDAIREKYAETPLSEQERTVLFLRVSSSSIKAKTSEGTVLGEMLKDIGCINIADGNAILKENLSIEEILQKDPHHIFAVAMGSDTQEAERALYSMIESENAWKELSAVKAGRIHVMDKTLFNLKPNARWAESYEILYQTLTQK